MSIADTSVSGLQRAWGISVIAATWAFGTIVVFPAAPVMQGAIGLTAVAMSCWVRHRLRQAENARDELSRPRQFTIAAVPPPSDEIYLGNGFWWEPRHAKALWDAYALGNEAPALQGKERGDLRIFGVGGLDARMISLPETHFNQHCGIFGSVGFGKTRLAELLLTQVIAREAPVIIIDPKGDVELWQRVAREGARTGRRVHHFDLVDPARSATYNPLASYQDPAQLGARFAALCPPATGDNRFFWERAAATGQGVAMAMDALRGYLIALGGEGTRPPAILLALDARWRLAHLDSAAEPSEPTIDAIATAMAKSELPKHYAPDSWVPVLTAGDAYGVERPHQLFCWMVMIMHFQIIDLPANSPGTANRGATPELWKIHTQQASGHPVRSSQHRALHSLFRHHVPDLAAASAALTKLEAALVIIHDFSSQDPEHWQRVNSTLPAALMRFRGEREQALCVARPDISFERVFAEREIVYFSLAAMVDRQVAEGLARAIIEDLTAHIGQRYATQQKALPAYLVADEIASFITPSFVDLLNKSRGAGLRCVVIGQSIADLEATLGNKAKADQVLANLNTVIQLRTPSAQDAKAFSERAGQVRMSDADATITAGQGSDGARGANVSVATAYQSRDRDLVPAQALQNLPVAQAFVSGMGRLGIFTFPLLKDDVRH